MHTIKLIAEGWSAVCLLFLAYRCWQGGMFDTGLERLFGFTKAHEGDEWLLPELLADLSAPRVN